VRVTPVSIMIESWWEIWRTSARGILMSAFGSLAVAMAASTAVSVARRMEVGYLPSARRSCWAWVWESAATAPDVSVPEESRAV
jgi:hypothetical protein